MNDIDILRHTVDHLKRNWFVKNTGIVAATLFDEGLMMTATSRFLPQHNRWQHAESVVLEQFIQKYGKPSPGSEMVVTLSPCMSITSSKRHGNSCSEQILASGISKIKFGWLDTKENRDIGEYLPLGLTAKLVKEAQLQRICGKIYDLFDQVYGAGGAYSHLGQARNPWDRVKEIVGLSIFG